MQGFLEAHLADVYLVYGLAFLGLGVVAAVLPRRDATLPFARDLWLIAAFGGLHGVYELILMRALLSPAGGVPPPWLSATWLLASFLPLFEFGRRLVLVAPPSFRSAPARVLLWPPAVYGAAVAAVVTLTLSSAHPTTGLTVGARYILGLLGSLLTGIGLAATVRRQASGFVPGSAAPGVWIAALGAFGYGLLIPVLAEGDPQLPAWLPTAAQFSAMFGIPVPVPRALLAVVFTCGLAMAVHGANVGIRIVESQLLLSQERLTEAQRIAHVGSWELNLRTNVLSWSDEVFRIFEIDDTRYGPSYEAFLSAVHPEDRDAVHRAYTRSLETREPSEITHRLRMADGRIKYVHEHCAGEYDDKGNIVRSMGTVQDITDRVAAEEAARVTQRRQQGILDSMFVFVGLYALDGTVVDLNRAPLEAGGVRREDVIGKPFWDTYWISHSTAAQERSRAALGRAALGETVRLDLDARMAGGKIATFDATFSPLRDETGRVIQVVGSGVDITDRKRAEVALRESEARLSEAQRIAHVGSWEWDAATDTPTWSLELCRILEVDPAKPVPTVKEQEKIYSAESMRKMHAAIQNALATGARYEIELERLREGAPSRWLLARGEVRTDAHGRIVGLRGTALDITARKQAEEALRESENRMRLLLANAPIIVYSLDRNGVFTVSDGKELAALHREPGEVVGKSAFEVFAHLPERLEYLRRGLQGEAFAAEVQIDGQWFESRHQPIRGAAGQVEGLVVVSTNITARRRAEAEARSVRSRLESVLGSISDGFFSLNTDWVYTYVNENAARFVGKTRQELLNRRIWDVFPQAEGSVWHQRYRQVMESRQPLQIEDYYPELDAWYEASVYPFEGGVSVYFHDVTERKRANLAVAASRERLATTLRSIGDAVITTDPQGRVDSMNPVAERLTGWPLAEAQGRLLPEVFHIVNETTRTRSESPVQRVLREGKVVGLANHTALIAKDGVERPIADSGAPIQGDDGRLLGVVLVFRDQTDERRAEAALRESEARYRRIVENSNEGIFSIDAHRRISFANPRMAEMLGTTPEQLIGRPVLDLVPAEERADGEERLARRTLGMAERHERRYLRSDGGTITVQISSVPVFDEAGKLAGATNMAVDITERKRLEQQFLQAQKMEAVGRLAGGVAHDFNNLLTVILGYAHILLAQLGPTHPQRPIVEEVRRAGERSANLAKRLLTFSRHHASDARPVILNDLISDMTPMLRQLLGEDVELVAQLAAPLAPVRVDSGQMEQVLMNLAVNARDAMTSGGRLTIETTEEDLNSEYAASHLDVRPGRYVRMAVTDTGVGMDKSVSDHLFEPFFTTKAPGKGTGLGLSTVYGIVRKSGGHIWVYSEPGRGTTFKIYLPSIATEEFRRELPAQAAPARGGRETILLVEDEAPVRDLLNTLLSERGYTVLTAADGAEALRLHGDLSQPVDLLLTDMVMPNLGGRELAEKLRARRPDLKVLLMSGYTEQTALASGNEPHRTRFLQKPVLPESLLNQVRSLLDS